MSITRPRAVAWAAVILAVGLVSVLLWRGLYEESREGLPTEYAWREAGEADLF